MGYFSTKFLNDCHVEDAWTDVIISKCGHFRTHIPDHRFQASIEAGHVGPFQANMITHTSCEYVRGPREMGVRAIDFYWLICQISGNAVFSQGDRQATLSPGGLTVIDPMMPSRFTLLDKNVHLCMHIPRTVMDAGSTNWPENCAKPLAGVAASIIATMARSSFQHPGLLSPAQVDAIGGSLLALLCSCLEVPEASETASAETHILRQVKAYLLANLQSEKLIPSEIARANGMSERHLHRLFSESGTSVCRWIREARLGRCAAQLTAAGQEDISITRIAFEAGFNDAAHFSRVFRQEYGVPPSQYRRMGRGRIINGTDRQGNGAPDAATIARIDN